MIMSWVEKKGQSIRALGLVFLYKDRSGRTFGRDCKPIVLRNRNGLPLTFLLTV